MINRLWILIFFLAMNFSSSVQARKITYLDEMNALGSVSGQGLACKSQKYHKYELLARAILVSKATSDQVERDGIISYNTGKVDAFMAMEASNFADCAEVIRQFDNQKIFQSVLYSDGRIKMYDGTMITPRKPYDASKLYVKDREAFLKADAAYKKAVARAQQLGQNAKKIPLKDANYENFAREFNR